MDYVDALIAEASTDIESEAAHLHKAELDFGEWMRQIKAQLEEKMTAAEDQVSFLKSIMENLARIKANNKNNAAAVQMEKIEVLKHRCNKLLDRGQILLDIFYDIDGGSAESALRAGYIL